MTLPGLLACPNPRGRQWQLGDLSSRAHLVQLLGWCGFDVVENAPASFRLVRVDKSGRYPALIPVPVPAADIPAGLPFVGEWKPRSCSRM